MKLDGVKKIAVLRANALGDFMFAIPALTALKETYPDAELVYLGRPWHKKFFKSRPGPVDRVIVIPATPGVRDERKHFADQKTLDDFFNEMKKEQFDIAIQLHGGGKNSNPFLKQLGAKLTVGLKTPDAESLDITVPYIYYENEIHRYLEVVKKIGAETTQIAPKIEVTRNDILAAKKICDLEKPFVVLHPGSTDIRRQWPPQEFAKVGDAVATHGYEVYITGSDNEKDIIDSVIAAMKFPAESLYEKLSLSALTGLLSKAAVVVSNDTGPLHLANAVGAKTVGLYWCGNVINGAPPFRENHRPLLSWIVTCPLCGNNCSRNYPFDRRFTDCQHEISFVTDIPVENVIAQTYSLLNIPHTSTIINKEEQKNHGRFNAKSVLGK